MKKVIWLGLVIALFLALAGASFVGGRVSVEPQTLKVVEAPMGQKIFVNEKGATQKFWGIPWLPFTGWGKTKETFLLQNLTFPIVHILWTDKDWNSSLENPTQATVIFLEGKLSVQNWSEFLQATNPKNYEKYGFPPNLTRAELIQLVMTQIAKIELSKTIYSPAEFQARINLILKTASPPETALKYLRSQRPWYFAYGILYFEALTQATTADSPDVLPEIKNQIKSALAYQNWDTGAKEQFQKIHDEHRFYLDFAAKDLPEAYALGQKVASEFLKTLGDAPQQQKIALAGLLPNDFAAKADSFLADYKAKHGVESLTVPEDYKTGQVPGFHVSGIYVASVVVTYTKAHLEVYEEVLEKQLIPFFTSLEEYKDTLNQSLWELALNTASSEETYYQWFLEQRLPVLLKDLGAKASRKKAFQFAISGYEIKIVPVGNAPPP